MSKRIMGNCMLLAAAMIWGAAFVAQTVGMDYLEPFAFQSIRCFLAATVLIPVIFLLDRRGNSKKPASAADRKYLLLSGCLCGLLLFTACSLQQIGLLYTEAGKAGFLTSLYIILVPLMGLFFRRKVRIWVWVAAVLALIGLYLLCAGDMAIGKGELYVLCCSLAFTGHILVIDHVIDRVDGVRLSCLQFLVCALLSLVITVCTETTQWSSVVQCWLPLAYAGILSGGAGYTLQIIGQANTEPTVASLLMSLEAVFAALFGWLLLRQTLTLPELLGCALVFAGVILAQLPEKRSDKKSILS